MCVQEEITQGVVSLSVETGKMTADLLQKAVRGSRPQNVSKSVGYLLFLPLWLAF